MGVKKPKVKGKKKHKNHPSSQKWKFYKIEGEKIVRGKYCPRCGPGIFLTNGPDRFYCGKCNYTEFLKKNKKDDIEN